MKSSKSTLIKDISKLGKDSAEWEQMIDRWIFSERDRRIVKRRLIDCVRIEPLAEEFDLSVSQTKRILYRAVNLLLEKIGN